MKRYEVKPFIEKEKKDIVVKLSFLTGYSIKAIGEDLCKHAINTDFAFYLAPYFKRSIRIKNIQMTASETPKKFPKNNKIVERVSLMVSEEVYEYAYSLSYAVGISLSKVIALMIEYSMNDADFFDDYVLNYLNEKIDPERKELLNSIIQDINRRIDREQPIATLLFHIADEYKEADESIEKAVGEFVSRWTAT